MPTAYLHLRRVSQWLSRWRAFRVMLDGQCIDKIRNGVSRVYEITPGEHELVITIDWVSSDPVVFCCAEGEAVRFACRHPSPTWRAALNPHSLVSSIEVMPDDDMHSNPGGA